MFPDVMWYSGQSYPVIYQATRGLGLVKRLRCSSVFKQRYSFKGGRDKWEIRPVFSGNNGWATSNLFQENLLSVWSLRTGSLASLKIRGKDRIWELRVLFTRCMNAQNLNMENRVEDWIWQLRIYFIGRMNFQILPRFSGILWKNAKSG